MKQKTTWISILLSKIISVKKEEAVIGTSSEKSTRLLYDKEGHPVKKIKLPPVSGLNFLHSHPGLENNLKVGEDHVIVDKEDWLQAKEIINELYCQSKFAAMKEELYKKNRIRN